ncbi:MAG: hypothetical protein QM734_07705 [Cyclobacteriaceae bacterium]
MKKSLIVFAVALIVAACSNERETVSGQKFTILKQGDGKEVDKNKILVLTFLMKRFQRFDMERLSQKWISMARSKKAIMKEQGKMFEVISMLTKDDSATFKISAYDFFVKSFHQGLPPKVDSSSLFTFCFTLKNALDSGQQVSKFQEELIAKQNEKIRKQQSEQLAKDTVVIDNYLSDKKITALKTKSGLRYVVVKNGAGPVAAAGQKVQVDYAGYVLAGGKYFDTSIESVAKNVGLLSQEGNMLHMNLTWEEGW